MELDDKVMARNIHDHQKVLYWSLKNISSFLPNQSALNTQGPAIQLFILSVACN